LHQKIRAVSDKDSDDDVPKTLRKTRRSQSKSSRLKGIIKIRAEINGDQKNDTRKMKQKVGSLKKKKKDT
jgi:hypothetical protein